MNGIDISQIKSITIYRDDDKKINEYLSLGWKFINLNTIEEDSRNYETGDFEKITLRLFTLGWPSILGEVKEPAEDNQEY